jgi:hypothetical protein
MKAQEWAGLIVIAAWTLLWLGVGIFIGASL